jgi:Domain of unknown function DUF29
MGQKEMAALYDLDFYAWTQQAGQLLRQGCFGEVDIEHVAEEIEDMGKGRRQALKSQTRRLILHLLKWQFQPERRSDSWLESIGDGRTEIADLLEWNLSLKPIMPELPGAVYDQAVKQAAREKGLPRKSFPVSCPYSFEQLADGDSLPEEQYTPWQY